MLKLCGNGERDLCADGHPRATGWLTTAVFLAGALLLVLAGPVAHAQGTDTGRTAIAQPEVQGPGHYLVTFGLNQTTLTEPNRRIIAQAAV
jgi:hypothetical protein